MENIQHFLTGCENFGVDKTDLFQTEDLYQGQNIPQVVSTLLALQNGRKNPSLPSCGRQHLI
jgi:hypothetical protein